MVKNLAIQQMRKKLIYRSWHRGMKEIDLILGTFADQTLEHLNEEDLRAYEKILEIPDNELLDYLHQIRQIPEEYNSSILKNIIHFLKNINE